MLSPKELLNNLLNFVTESFTCCVDRNFLNGENKAVGLKAAVSNHQCDKNDGDENDDGSDAGHATPSTDFVARVTRSKEFHQQVVAAATRLKCHRDDFG